MIDVMIIILFKLIGFVIILYFVFVAYIIIIRYDCSIMKVKVELVMVREGGGEIEVMFLSGLF